MRDNTLLEVAHKAATDKSFRILLLNNPKEALSQLGLSPDACEAFLAVVPVALTASMVLLDGPDGVGVDWSRNG